MSAGDWTTTFRNDGTAFYLLCTNKAWDMYDWNNWRPLTMSLTTGILNINGHAEADVRLNSIKTGVSYRILLTETEQINFPQSFSGTPTVSLTTHSNNILNTVTPFYFIIEGQQLIATQTAINWIAIQIPSNHND